MTSFWWLILFFIEDFFIFRLESVMCKQYTKTNGNNSKYTNIIDISITGLVVWEGVECTGSPVEEEVGGVEEGVEGVDLSVGEGVASGLSASFFSFSLFMYVLCDFLPRSCLLGSFATFSGVLAMFILSKKFAHFSIRPD